MAASIQSATNRFRLNEVKLRILEEHIKEQTKTREAARWSRDLHRKDAFAARARVSDEHKGDEDCLAEIGHQQRREKITALFRREEAEYERELESFGLALKRDRP